MRVRPHDAGNVEMDIAAGLRSPLTREVDSDAASLTGHGFDVHPAALLSKVVVRRPCEAGDPFEDVAGEDEVHPRDLGETVLRKMLVKAEEGEYDHDAMNAQEGLIESMAERRPSLNA